MKKLRILFLAVLAMALMASGVFAATALTTDSADKVVIKVDDTEITSKVSTDVTSPDTEAVLTFDFSATDFANYDIELSEDVKGFKVLSSKDGVWKISFDATQTAEKGLTSKDYSISFKFTEKDSSSTNNGETWTATKQGDGRDYRYKDTKEVGLSYYAVTVASSAEESDFTPSATKLCFKWDDSTGWSLAEGVEEISITSTPTPVDGNDYYTVTSADITVANADSFDAYVAVGTVFYTYDDEAGYFASADTYTAGTTYYTLTGTKETVTDGFDEEKVYYTSGDEVAADDNTTDTGAAFDEYLMRQSYAAAAGDLKYTFTFTFTVSYNAGTTEEEEGGNTNTGGTPNIDWYDSTAAYPFNNKTWTIYLSADADGSVQTTTAVKVSADFTAKPVFVISPATNSYVEFDIGDAEEVTASSDTVNNVYTFEITATPVASTDTAGVDFTAYVTVTSGSTVLSNDALDFTVIVSDDTSSDVDTGKTDVITGWTLTATANKTSFDLSYYGTAEVTITAKPADSTVTYTFTDDADSTEDYTLEEEDAVKGSTAYTKKYTFKAGETADDYTITFTVKAVSGDTQSVDIPVTFSVAFDAANQGTPDKPEDATTTEFGVASNEHKEVPVRLLGGGTKTFTLYGEQARKQAFKDGSGLVAWAVRAPYKVKPTFGRQGWWLRFWAKLLKDYFTVTLNSANEFGKPASSMVTLVATEQNASRDAAVSVAYLAEDSEGHSGAVFEVDVSKAAFGLPAGDSYDVQTTYTTEAAAEAAGDNAALSDPDTAGTMEGKDTSGSKTPGEQDPGTDPGTDPSDPGSDLVDKVLGGSSGGCDAGFGALALALAASMIFVRKRS